MTNKLLHVQYERNAHCRSSSPGATSACHICNPIYEAKQTGVDLFCFIADSLTFRCGFCHRHVVFAQAEQQTTKTHGHICCPPENDSQRNLHNGKALDLRIFLRKCSVFFSFSSNVSGTLHRFESRFATISKNLCSKFYNSHKLPHIQSIL